MGVMGVLSGDQDLALLGSHQMHLVNDVSPMCWSRVVQSNSHSAETKPNLTGCSLFFFFFFFHRSYQMWDVWLEAFLSEV